MAAQGGSSSKFGRKLKSASHQHYNTARTWLKHKLRNIARGQRFNPEEMQRQIEVVRAKQAAYSPKKAT